MIMGKIFFKFVINNTAITIIKKIKIKAALLLENPKKVTTKKNVINNEIMSNNLSKRKVGILSEYGIFVILFRKKGKKISPDRNGNVRFNN